MSCLAHFLSAPADEQCLPEIENPWDFNSMSMAKVVVQLKKDQA